MADMTGDTSCETTMEYWDCECDGPDVGFGYIHPKKCRKCPKCGSEPDDSADARINEVKAAGLPLGDINSVFAPEEINIILTAARVAFADADLFDYVAEEMDIADNDLIELRMRLQSFIDKE